MTGKAGIHAYEERVAETERVRERKRARVERGAGDVTMEPVSGEQIADRRAVASGEDKRQHDENRMRDIRIGEKMDRRQHMKQNLTS